MNKSKNIKAIDKDAVHRICSGQVVLNLAVAVKELVENSLDAGATVIDVRLREYGSELIEVTDNGSGVAPDNFQGLTLKHHTSKLQDFSDLVSVETFGFRGEALSSLCSLSDLTITTRHHSSDCGSRLQYDHNGLLTSSTSVARQVGTTVSLENIFSTLPVRHKEFLRHLKREFGKMTQLIYAYCLVSTGVKITCTNHTKKGGKTVVVATQGCKTVRENIACVFGTKQLASLLELKTVAPSNEMLEQLNLKNIEMNVDDIFQLEGMVSSCAHGVGRSTNDRQFYYVNSRPCEPSKVIKAVNEVYHQYNLHQQPFVFLNICSSRESVDVNVTPDKRQVFLEHEKFLVATVKTSLQALYENIPSTYMINNIQPSAKTLHSPQRPSLSQNSPASILSQFRHISASKRPSGDLPAQKVTKQAKLDSVFVKRESTSAVRNFLMESCASYTSEEVITSSRDSADITTGCESLSQIDSEFSAEESCENTFHNPTLQASSGGESSNVSHIKSEDLGKEYVSQKSNLNRSLDHNVNCAVNRESNVVDNSNILFQNESGISSQSSSTSDLTPDMSAVDPAEPADSKVDSGNCSPHSVTVVNMTCDLTPDMSAVDPAEPADSKVDSGNSSPHSVPIVNKTCDSKQNNLDTSISIKYDTEVNCEHRQRREINITMDKLREYFQQSCEMENAAEGKRVRFRAVIDPSKNKQAEQELSREISKDMFAKMDVIGQFNLGFIIAKLGSDLFIVDQHATDEKYNFETLQRTETLSSQKLVVPQKLELTAVSEAVLVDNIDVFKANGFDFQVDESAPTTSRVKLTSIPMSRNWTFGKEDIDELLFMLQDAPGVLCRPSRVRAMFASRACRKSVMIGSALSLAEMKRLLVHMGEIEQPWNCPHGRPTMRHLINLDFL